MTRGQRRRIRVFALERDGYGDLRDDAQPGTPERYAVWVACRCGGAN